jgi:cell division protein FtsB
MRKNKKTKFYIWLIIVLIGAAYLFFNEFGVLKFIQLKNDVDSLQQKISKVDSENKALEAEIDSLKRKEPAKIEQVARERYDMMRKGEQKIEMNEVKK